jgi:hypothetical protein
MMCSFPFSCFVRLMESWCEPIDFLRICGPNSASSLKWHLNSTPGSIYGQTKLTQKVRLVCEIKELPRAVGAVARLHLPMPHNMMIRVKVGNQVGKPSAKLGEGCALLIGKLRRILPEITFDLDTTPPPIVEIRSGVGAPDHLVIAYGIERPSPAFHDDSATADREMLTDIRPASLEHVAMLNAPRKLKGNFPFGIAEKRIPICILSVMDDNSLRRCARKRRDFRRQRAPV